MMLTLSTYSADEIAAIAGWLREELSASEIANRLSARRHSPLSRNAIIGIVHRNKILAAIGLAGRAGKSGVPAAPSVPRAASPRLHAGNIRGKKEGRALDPPFAPPKPRHVDDGVAPYVYDATTRHVGIAELKPRDCRWPVNSAARGEQHLFCGKPSHGERPYCPHHCRRAGSGYVAAQTGDVRRAMKSA